MEYNTLTRSDKPQSDKFKKAAREIEADESEANFEKRLKKLVKQKPTQTSNKS